MRADRKVLEPRANVTRLQAPICALLACLLLFNPFLFLIHYSAGLSVHHLSRNRATVGSAELQHFSPVSEEMSADILLEERVAEIKRTQGGQTFQLATDLTRGHVVTADFSSNLWFRPPPSA